MCVWCVCVWCVCVCLCILMYLLLRLPGHLADSLDMWYERYDVGVHFQHCNFKSPTVINYNTTDALARE